MYCVGGHVYECLLVWVDMFHKTTYFNGGDDAWPVEPYIRPYIEEHD